MNSTILCSRVKLLLLQWGNSNLSQCVLACNVWQYHKRFIAGRALAGHKLDRVLVTATIYHWFYTFTTMSNNLKKKKKTWKMFGGKAWCCDAVFLNWIQLRRYVYNYSILKTKKSSPKCFFEIWRLACILFQN